MIFHKEVLMLAPIGKAAYNIKGNTIHSVLAIPASQSLRDNKSLDSSRLSTLRDNKSLDKSRLSTLRCRLGGIKQVGCIVFARDLRTQRILKAM